MPWAVIFDMDGVLVDSAEAHFESWMTLAREQQAAFSREAFDRTFGRTSRSILLEEFDSALNDAEVERLDERKEALFRQVLREEFPVMPGAVELIDDLRAAGAMLGVGSSGPPKNVRLILEKLGRADSFGALVTGTDVMRGKPDPQVFQLVASRLGVEPARCVVIEDAPAGIEAAHAAGMRCVGLVSSGRTVSDLQRADRVIASLNEIAAAELQRMAD